MYRMKSSAARLIACAALVLVIAACGSTSTQDAPGSWGASDTNIALTASLSPSTVSVDVCNCLTASTLSADFVTETIYPDLPANTLHLEYYTVSFVSNTSTAPEVAPAFYSMAMDMPASGVEVQLVSAEEKAAYLDALNAPSYTGPDAGSYTVVFKFYGVDDYGSSAGATAYAAVTMNKSTACAPPAIAPTSVSTSGFANPDANDADNVTFTITGGTEPYKVYSDNDAVIAAPGVIGPGVGQFTVDPDIVLSSTNVTLTVVDAYGLSAETIVTVTP